MVIEVSVRCKVGKRIFPAENSCLSNSSLKRDSQTLEARDYCDTLNFRSKASDVILDHASVIPSVNNCSEDKAELISVCGVDECTTVT